MITSYFGHVAFQVWDYRNNGVGVIRVDGGVDCCQFCCRPVVSQTGGTMVAHQRTHHTVLIDFQAARCFMYTF